MRVAPDDGGRVRVACKDGHFVRDRAGSELGYSEAEVENGREGERGEEVRVGGDDEAYERGGGGREVSVLDEVGVDDGVEVVIVDRVVDVRVLVVVDPVGWVQRRREPA